MPGILVSLQTALPAFLPPAPALWGTGQISSTVINETLKQNFSANFSKIVFFCKEFPAFSRLAPCFSTYSSSAAMRPQYMHQNFPSIMSLRMYPRPAWELHAGIPLTGDTEETGFIRFANLHFAHVPYSIEKSIELLYMGVYNEYNTEYCGANMLYGSIAETPLFQERDVAASIARDGSPALMMTGVDHSSG